MGPTASQITSLTIVYSIVYSGTDQRQHQSSASLAFVRGIQRRPVNSPHKWPVTRKMFSFDYVIMTKGDTKASCLLVLKLWRIHRQPMDSPHKGPANPFHFLTSSCGTICIRNRYFSVFKNKEHKNGLSNCHMLHLSVPVYQMFSWHHHVGWYVMQIYIFSAFKNKEHKMV